MTTDFTVTLTSVLVAVLVMAFLWILGVGVIPILQAFRGLIEEKQALARQQITSIERSFSASSSLPQTLVHDFAAGIEVRPTDGWVITGAGILTEALKTLQQVLPVKDEKITPEEFAEGAEQVAEFVEKLTDKVANNLPPMFG